jgi:hypothetical protein
MSDDAAVARIHKLACQIFGACTVEVHPPSVASQSTPARPAGDCLSVHYAGKIVNSYHEGDARREQSNDMWIFNARDLVEHCKAGGLDGGDSLYWVEFVELGSDRVWHVGDAAPRVQH